MRADSIASLGRVGRLTATSIASLGRVGVVAVVFVPTEFAEEFLVEVLAKDYDFEIIDEKFVSQIVERDGITEVIEGYAYTLALRSEMEVDVSKQEFFAKVFPSSGGLVAVPPEILRVDSAPVPSSPWNLTPPTGSNFLVVFSLAAETGAQYATSVSWDSNLLSQVSTASEDAVDSSGAVYHIADPGELSADLTWSGEGGTHGLFAIWLSGVNTSSPIRDGNAQNQIDVSSLSHSVLSDLTDLCLTGTVLNNSNSASPDLGVAIEASHLAGVSSTSRQAVGSEIGQTSQDLGWLYGGNSRAGQFSVSIRGS